MTSLKEFSLEGKNAWITGASYGIGFNIAKAFVAAGAKTIIFNDINEAALERGLANYKEAGIENVKGYVCDVTNEVAVKELVEKIHAEVGNIDILVNNAGIIKRIPMHEMKRAEFQQVIDIDLVGPFICSSAVIPEMMERREGKIINICSMMSELGRETVSAYAAAKGGQLLSASVSLMAAVIHSIVSSVPRLLPDVGSTLLSLVALPYSWLPRLLMLSMATCSMSMVVFSLISASSLNKTSRYTKKKGMPFLRHALILVKKVVILHNSVCQFCTSLELNNLLGCDGDRLLCCRIYALTLGTL